MFWKLTVWVLLAWLCSASIRILMQMDWNKRAYNHVPGPCRLVAGADGGSEDIELIADQGIAFISSGAVTTDRQRGKVKGRILVYDLKSELNKKLFKADELTIEPSKSLDLTTFAPLGMTSYVSKGRITLYVVNHPPGKYTVECFTFKKNTNTLVHTKTIQDNLFYGANNLVAVGADKFFLTNFAYFWNPVLQIVFDVLLQLPLGSLVFYDGKKAALVESWQTGPNGIAVDKDMKHLYVAYPKGEYIRDYSLKRDMSIEKVADISLLTSPDNLFVDPTNGDLWTGAHPVLYKVVRYLLNPEANTSPSQVLRIRVQEDHKSWIITEPFADDGDRLAASSAAVYHDKQLLIGTIHHRLMHCDVLNPEIQ